MKSIGIDCRFALIKCGLGRYTSELVSHLLRRDDPFSYTLFVRSSDEEWLHDLKGSPNIIQADVPHYSFAEQIKLPSIIKSANIDLLFSPHFNVPFNCPVPFIVTIHDLILHHYPNQASFAKHIAYKMLMNHVVQSSSKIITVSNFVCEELSHVYGEAVKDKARTIYEGVSEKFSPQPEDNVRSVLSKHCIKKPYFLYVGNAKQHKNVQMLLDAYRESDSSHSLVLASGGKELSRLNMPEGVQVLSDVSDEDLPALYSGATAFVSASVYEGFGLPIAEAQACGCPVIAVNRSAISEVADENALLVEPSIHSFVSAMQSIDSLESSEHETFAWSKAASMTADIFAKT